MGGMNGELAQKQFDVNLSGEGKRMKKEYDR